MSQKAKSGGYKRKGGTHGSLSKAGKTRDLQRRDWKGKEVRKRSSKGSLPTHNRKHKCPKTNNRKRHNVWYNKKYVVPLLIKLGVIRDEEVHKRRM